MPLHKRIEAPIRRAAKSVRLVRDIGRSDTLRFLTFAPPGHFYSPVPDHDEIARIRERRPPPERTEVPGIELNAKRQLDLLSTFSSYAADLPFGAEPQSSARFHLDNEYFAYGDAVALYCFLRHLQPVRVIEVGSGFSTALMLDTRARSPEAPFRLTCVEPYPERLRTLMRDEDAETCSVLEQPVQEVATDEFGTLESGDILFIDSSHVAKTGSDVLDLVYRILPALRSGVYVHIHDIFWPFEYPPDWLDEGRAWNEAYLIRAFLQYNAGFEIAFFNDYLATVHRSSVREQLPLMLERPSNPVNPGNSSLWLRKL